MSRPSFKQTPEGGVRRQRLANEVAQRLVPRKASDGYKRPTHSGSDQRCRPIQRAEIESNTAKSSQTNLQNEETHLEMKLLRWDVHHDAGHGEALAEALEVADGACQQKKRHYRSREIERVPLHAPSPRTRQVRRTPELKCEAVPASERDGAGMRRHVHPSNHAAESFVSFIPLFDGTALEPVLDVQACHFTEVPRVVRYDDETKRESLRSNQGVEHADRLSAFRKIGSHFRKALR
jgi:hypothetical protein